MEKTDTIVAISTGTGAGAISIIRMSGADSIGIADKLFSAAKNSTPKNFEDRKLMLGKLETENFCEQAMCVVFRAPRSYTGEDMVEFQCHGGTQIATGVLRACMTHGARIAESGEFTKRAFLNGKTSLSSAEGMMDMINAESDAEVRAGYSLLTGNLSKLATSVQGSLNELLAEIEVSFDYPEETIEEVTKSKVKTVTKSLIDEIDTVLCTASSGVLLKSGVSVVLIGKPNVGKSSLLNALLQKERAIVTEIAGTTRDTIEGTAIFGGVKYNFTDTAGIQDTEDKVEKIGVDKAKSLISSADIVLYLVDNSKAYGSEDERLFESISKTKFIVVKTKGDLPKKCKKSFEGEITISTMTGDGIEELKRRLEVLSGMSNIDASNLIITNERHRQALAKTKDDLTLALSNVEDVSLDLVSVDLKQAYTDIGEITGTTTSEEIIDTIFSKFCLGK